jgi:FdhD protein
MTLRLTVDQAIQCANQLPDCQPIHKQTRSAHAALIFDQHGALLASAEDVGRHNALDKAIGKVFMDRQIGEAAFGVMSSRLSYELIQKAARARIELMIGVSRPTSLAVELARAMNMTLACARDTELMVFCGENRLTLH